MSSDSVLWEKDGQIGVLTLNRPERLNAINDEIREGIAAAIEDATNDPDTRVIIIRGAGRAFSSGYDLSPGDEASQPTQDTIDDRNRLQRNTDLWLKIWDCPKPVIAQVHGYCLGGATQLCIFCDITIIAEDAIVGFPGIPVGGGYISPMWTWLVGPKRAKEMSFVPGSQISGKQASDWGWANRAVPPEELESTVRAMAMKIATVPSKILQMKKLSVNRTVDTQGFRVAVTFGSEIDALLHASEPVEKLANMVRTNGLKEAIAAFNRGETE